MYDGLIQEQGCHEKTPKNAVEPEKQQLENAAGPEQRQPRTPPAQKNDARDHTGSADRRALEAQRSHSGTLNLKEDVLLLFVALVLLAFILIGLVALPVFCGQTLIDTGAFLARATAHTSGVVEGVSSSSQDYSNPEGGTIVVKCYEVITFQPATGQPVTFNYNYFPDLRINCDREGDHLTVLYNPRNPNDARVAREVYNDRTTAIIGGTIWNAGVIGALMVGPLAWRKYRQKRRQGQNLRDWWLNGNLHDPR
jgi:hypothetical protein